MSERGEPGLEPSVVLQSLWNWWKEDRSVVRFSQERQQELLLFLVAAYALLIAVVQGREFSDHEQRLLLVLAPWPAFIGLILYISWQALVYGHSVYQDTVMIRRLARHTGVPIFSDASFDEDPKTFIGQEPRFFFPITRWLAAGARHATFFGIFVAASFLPLVILYIRWPNVCQWGRWVIGLAIADIMLAIVLAAAFLWIVVYWGFWLRSTAFRARGWMESRDSAVGTEAESKAQGDESAGSARDLE